MPLHIPRRSQSTDFSLVDISGICKRPIVLANMTHAELHNIHVTGYDGPFLTRTNVQGVGRKPR